MKRYLDKRLHFAGTVPWVLMNIQAVKICKREEGKMTDSSQKVLVQGKPLKFRQSNESLL